MVEESDVPAQRDTRRAIEMSLRAVRTRRRDPPVSSEASRTVKNAARATPKAPPPFHAPLKLSNKP